MSDAERLGLDAVDWLLVHEEPDDPTLYSGTAGVVLTLLEAHHHTGEQRYADEAERRVDGLSGLDGGSLYFGQAGGALVQHAVRRDPLAALAAVRAAFDGERFEHWLDLLLGNAGVALTALALGDHQLAIDVLAPLPELAEPTSAGVIWQTRAGREARLHHVSHGTLGVVMALVAVGAACGRADLVELGLAGAADVVARDEAGPTGFLVPHSDPQNLPDRVERYSFGWCHGPVGDAQAFRLLAAATGDAAWSTLAERCWTSVLGSGLPQRLRPGFWDNSGRCCGTAGVLALASDRRAELDDDPTFGRLLVADLERRAVRTSAGVCWRNTEHTAAQPLLPSRSGWAMGNAGIARELLRWTRVEAGGDPRYAVALPDQPVVGDGSPA
ncbi:lanthionine synthetase LanC family protein [Nocardioides mangrovicus]|uniref:lanthionine synthetase LanC family protein n=1 Tax=Nocardioides mangrovicus TaxID=2478913 RepID=UPI0018E0792A|nr:lanthionine synthetase LanC family protein [Nocardioides mangrovicus]